MRVIARVVAIATAVVVAVATPGSIGARDRRDGGHYKSLHAYATDTWASFVALTDRRTGLPHDNVTAGGVQSGYTSPTNIGALMWSALGARDLGIIGRREARRRIRRVLTTLEGLERHEASGQFFNWYDPSTGEVLRAFPSGDPIQPFLSQVDNGWLATALVMVTNGMPSLEGRAHQILDDMDFSFYYDPNAGLMRGGAWVEEPEGCSVRDEAKDVWFTCHHYGALNTEPRIASYIGIARDGVPPTHYFKMARTFPDTCDWSWQEMRPEGTYRTYLGVSVYEGTYRYRGMRLVPAWGGSMFEALMPALFVPEEQWGPRSWGVNHPLFVAAQRQHGLAEADYGYWGFSPANNPDGGYREYGVDAIGLDPAGYTSDQQRTTVDYGFPGCPGRETTSIPDDYGDGVVTPHASFLALDFAPKKAMKNLKELRRDFRVYGWGGFYDSVEVTSGQVSRYYLALDQGMVMAAIANALTGDELQSYFARAVEPSIRPLLKMERFSSGRTR